MKKKKITYNPKGLKRVDNIYPKQTKPRNDLHKGNTVIKKEGENWIIIKK